MPLEPVTMSGEKSATALISTLPGRLVLVDIVPPSAGTALLQIYDNNTSATSGATVILDAFLTAGSTTSIHIHNAAGRVVNKGIYAVLTATTTDTKFNVGYI